MIRPAAAFDDPSWGKLTASETRVLMTLALSQPRRVSTRTLLAVYRPEKAGSARLMHHVAARCQPAAATFGLVIVEDGEGYRLVPKAIREPGVRPSIAKPKPAKPAEKPAAREVAPEVREEPAPARTTRSEILDLSERGFAISMIATVLRIPYAEVSAVLRGRAS